MDRAAISIAESTDRFFHHEEGRMIAAAFIMLVAGVGASRTSQTISPGASTVTRNSRGPAQAIRIGSVVFALMAGPK